MTRDKIPLGLGLMLVFCLTAPLLDVASKLAAASLPVGEITAARFAFQALLLLPLALALRRPLTAPPRLVALLALRAALLAASTFCFVAAVRVMPIADTLALVFIEPFIVLFLGRLLFGEAVGRARLLASLAAFGGALCVIQPSLASVGLAALYPLGTAFLFSFYVLLTRALAARLDPITLQWQTALTGSLLCLPLLWASEGSGLPALDPIWPEGLEWLWLFGVGFWAGVSHLAMTYALKYAPAATLVPLQYLEIVFAVIFGYWVFGDFPNALTWAGIAIISGAGLYLVWFSQRAARAPAFMPDEAL